MTTADDLTPVWQDAAGILSDAFHADTYVVMRRTEVPDGSGGKTTTVQEVESGRCALDVTGRLGSEGQRGDVVIATSSYVAELPIDSDVREEDTLVINGRAFAIVSKPKRGGNHDLFTLVELEERS